MLIGYILLGMFVICTLFSAASGASPAAGGSVMEGAQEAVSFCVSVAGGVCLWSAVLELMERCGVSAALSRALRPLPSRDGAESGVRLSMALCPQCPQSPAACSVNAQAR